MARLVRCPVCLRPGRDPGPRGQLRCRGCQRPFSGSTALPFDSGSSVVAGGHADLLLSGGSVAVAALIVFFVVSRMDWVAPVTDGPAFLFGYLMLAAVLRALLAAVRGLGLDTPVLTVAALGVFEGIGLVRWLQAGRAGMQDFEVLAVMMAAGLLLFLVRIDGNRGRGPRRGRRAQGTGSCSGASSCGGCGAGSSGGGGCGGCGGGD